MPIRPIDMQSMLPRMQQVKMNSQQQANKEAINLQNLQNETVRKTEIKEQRVNTLDAKNDAKIKRDYEREEKRKRKQGKKKKDNEDDEPEEKHLDILI